MEIFFYNLNLQILSVYLFGCFLIATLLLVLSFLVTFKNTPELLRTSYECGFTPFDQKRTNFDVNFFLVGLLFLLFDIEVVFLLPLGVFVTELSVVGFLGCTLFFIVLMLGFFFEISSDGLVFN